MQKFSFSIYSHQGIISRLCSPFFHIRIRSYAILSDYVALYYSNLSIFIQALSAYNFSMVSVYACVRAIAWHNFDNKKVFSVFWVHAGKFYAMFVVTFLLGVAWHAIRFVFYGFSIHEWIGL